ncbi:MULTISPECIES: AtpZ/AtpI family protein [unclassified Flavobacterium]|uniref:AtpZ/AtpI family protein n=1 Tax=unclassified Flavobacterium TaxID=196869 RepID=UPI000F0CEAC3|nr:MULTISPECIES: AtpZ/AtpI family protein [unclassified Flavobacterium]AYN05857.1 AtpZ/AtpI family protein [Flavobacterium sp. 140616W15]MCD0475665.1 AtpZ/AtpI family protein [Flavobacterium sp. EDS]
MTDKEPNENQKNNKWLVFINIPIQMGVIIFLFSYLGIWLDEKYSNGGSLWTIILSLFSVFLALYNVIRQVKNLNK